MRVPCAVAWVSRARRQLCQRVTHAAAPFLLPCAEAEGLRRRCVTGERAEPHLRRCIHPSVRLRLLPRPTASRRPLACLAAHPLTRPWPGVLPRSHRSTAARCATFPGRRASSRQLWCAPPTCPTRAPRCLPSALHTTYVPRVAARDTGGRGRLRVGGVPLLLL